MGGGLVMPFNDSECNDIIFCHYRAVIIIQHQYFDKSEYKLLINPNLLIMVHKCRNVDVEVFKS